MSFPSATVEADTGVSSETILAFVARGWRAFAIPGERYYIWDQGSRYFAKVNASLLFCLAGTDMPASLSLKEAVERCVRRLQNENSLTR